MKINQQQDALRSSSTTFDNISNNEEHDRTLKLACIGVAKDEAATRRFIQSRLEGQKLLFWPLETRDQDWSSRPMCVFIYDGHGISLVDTVPPLPMLNIELLTNHLASFVTVEVAGDPYGLKGRIMRAIEPEQRAKLKADRDSAPHR